MQQDQLDLLSAALRHQEDAEHLLASSKDQSWHLAGFATECVRKAVLTNDQLRKSLAHEQGMHFDALFEIVVSLDPRALQLRVSGWADSPTQLSMWSESHRYDPTGRHVGKAAALVGETGTHFDRTLTQLWLTEGFNPGAL
ncbi:MAG: hypothetical protein U0271_31845 [Polyangiaceae bacterium]